jgi:tRNA (cmo5U34)-methyltransferase
VNVGDGIDALPAAWSFSDPEVAERFPEHAERSIPGYREGQELICQLSDFFVQGVGVQYELGCATGELLRLLGEHTARKPQARWIGIDSAPEMAAAARAHTAELPSVEIRCEDILAAELEPADFVVAHYVMQFVHPRMRQQVFDKVYASLNWGGGFVLFEKVRGPDARFQDMLTTLYTQFKRRNGFSADEILNKTESLKGVQHPFSSQANLDLLRRAGFVDVVTVHKQLCFEGFLAIK